MANYTKFLAAQEHQEKNAHPKCRRRGVRPRLPKILVPKTEYSIQRQVVTLIPPQIIHEIDKDVRHRYNRLGAAPPPEGRGEAAHEPRTRREDAVFRDRR